MIVSFRKSLAILVEFGWSLYLHCVTLSPTMPRSFLVLRLRPASACLCLAYTATVHRYYVVFSLWRMYEEECWFWRGLISGDRGCCLIYYYRSLSIDLSIQYGIRSSVYGRIYESHGNLFYFVSEPSAANPSLLRSMARGSDSSVDSVGPE